jgi:hypothetical protein
VASEFSINTEVANARVNFQRKVVGMSPSIDAVDLGDREDGMESYRDLFVSADARAMAAVVEQTVVLFLRSDV